MRPAPTSLAFVAGIVIYQWLIKSLEWKLWRGNSRASWRHQHFDMGRGGSSSGSTTENGSRSPGFDSHWELGFFSLFSFSFSSVNQWSVLNQFPKGGPSLLILLELKNDPAELSEAKRAQYAQKWTMKEF